MGEYSEKIHKDGADSLCVSSGFTVVSYECA